MTVEARCKLCILLLLVAGTSSSATVQKKVEGKTNRNQKPAHVEKAKGQEKIERASESRINEESKPVAQNRNLHSRDCQTLEREARDLGERGKELETQAHQKKEEAVDLLQRAQTAERQRLALAHADRGKGPAHENDERAMQAKERERVEFHRASDEKEKEREALHREANRLTEQRAEIEHERKARCDAHPVVQQRR